MIRSALGRMKVISGLTDVVSVCCFRKRLTDVLAGRGVRHARSGSREGDGESQHSALLPNMSGVGVHNWKSNTYNSLV